MTSKLELDTRLDPRIKAAFAGIDLGAVRPNVSSREELHRHRHDPAGRRRQRDDRTPLPGARYPWDIAVITYGALVDPAR
jgi:hypothetical protein